MTRLLIAAFTLFISMSRTRADDWPQWRGPNRDGVAPNTQLPVKWLAKPPAARWTVTVGKGCSGPVVAGGKVFILGREKNTERLYCFDADSGKQAWAVDYAETFKSPDPTVPVGPNSTPTVDRDRVYSFGQGGKLHCVDIASGKVLWKHDCLKEYWGVAKGPLGDDAWFPPCGCAASPLVDGDTVIVPVGGKKAGAFTAFDRYTGEIRWKALNDRSSYASPLLRSLAGAEQLVGFTGTRMVGLRRSDRAVLWEFPFKALFEQTIVSPVVWKDLVIVSGEGRATTALKLTRSGEKVTKSVAWTCDDLKAYLTTPVVFGEHLLGYDMRTNRVVCVSVKTGELAWASRVPGSCHSIVLAGGALLVLSSDGDLYVFEATEKDAVQLAKWKVSEKGAWAHLAVAGNRLYVKDKEKLYCYDVR